jgi:D-glycero-D-manno-heptose 1,7-bisphosphate phosphatase
VSRYQLIIFDRDGTLCYEHMHHRRDLSRLRPYPFVGSLLKDLQDDGYRLAVATNQSGIGHAFLTLEAVTAVHERFTREWGISPAVYICPHVPDDHCSCRKPQPGLLNRALEDHQVPPEKALMIGDSLTDYHAARAAGVDFALVQTGKGRQTQERLGDDPCLVFDTASDLGEYLIRHVSS